MSDMFSLEGKVAAIVGGAGGIGELIAAGLAERGARVAVASRNMQKLEEVARRTLKAQCWPAGNLEN
jgi:NAD(P)-dependent dehydrogenase (short-subunit alcohol dehydrogenase family)